MYLVVIAWIYVVLLMSVAEATNTNGSVLGAIMTFVLYGALPVALVVYLMGTPARRRAIKKKEAEDVNAAKQAAAAAAAAQQAGSAADVADAATPSALSAEPDAGGHAASGAKSGPA